MSSQLEYHENRLERLWSILSKLTKNITPKEFVELSCRITSLSKLVGSLCHISEKDLARSPRSYTRSRISEDLYRNTDSLFQEQ
jgi:hypothetical protein